MPLRVAVVGSGFAAWGTVLALAGKPDVSLHVFDIGLVTADASRSERPVPNAKPCGGSFFCYGINDSRFPLRLDSARMCSSHALGGHSVVYSGAILYPRDADLANWPAESRPRAEDYAAVLARLPLLKDRDAIEDAFPTVPSQADLAGKPPLHAEASVLGMSRLAVSEFAGAVRPFSLCDEFRTLHSAGLLTYVGNCYVSRTEISDGRVQLSFTLNGVPHTDSFDAVFLGAGCVNSTAIVDRSMHTVGCRDYAVMSSGIAIHAFVRVPWFSSPSSRLRKRNGLPEYFLEVRSRLTDDAWSHTQLAGINDQIIDAIRSRLPRFLWPTVAVAKHVVYFALSGIRSEKAPAAVVRSCLIPDSGAGAMQSVTVTEPPTARHPALVRAVRRAASKHWRTLRMVPLPFGERLADFFRGNRHGGWHFGGTLPMRQQPVRVGECSPDAEVCGLPGVFIVDSAAFPSIPSSTIALLTAAHGHRVAKQWRSILQHDGAQA